MTDTYGLSDAVLERAAAAIGYFVSFAIVTESKDEKDQVLDTVRELIDTWPVDHRDWSVAVTPRDQPNKIPLHHSGIIQKFTAGEDTLLAAHDLSIRESLVRELLAEIEQHEYEIQTMDDVIDYLRTFLPADEGSAS